MTSFSDDGSFQLGENASTIIKEKCEVIDKLQSSLDLERHHERRRKLRRRLHRRIREIKNKRKELHHKVANFLTKNYETIILPEFKTSEMVSKLRSKVARSMLNLSFYQFKLHMKTKCAERGNKLLIVGEEYTTKTCTRCGELNRPNDREYKCGKCHLEVHRDVNGARNILLKNAP